MGESKNRPTNCQLCPSKMKGIFCDVSDDVLESLSSQKITNLYKKGQTLFVEGNPSYGLYCVSSGNVKVSKTGPDGKENIVRLATGGDVLGHRSLFTQEYYSATATAIEDTKICFIDKKYVMEMVNKQPSVASNLIQKLGRDLGASETKVASFSQKNVFQRIAEFLLLLKESHGEKHEHGVKITLKLTREEMASYVGTATETLIRNISELKDEKVIEQEGKNIIVVNEKRLIEFAELGY